jgi:hypothetical protein
MDYGQFKGIQFLLFFGAALSFGLWQVIAIKRDLRREQAEQSEQQLKEGGE